MTALRAPFPLLRVGSRTISVPAFGLAGLVAVSCIVRIVIAWHHTSARYFPDEYIYSQLGNSIAHGHLLIRDQPAHFPALLGPLLAAPLWRFFAFGTAYHLVQAENAIGASLAAIPVYVLARQLKLGRGWAFACALYTLVVPMLTMAPFIITDFIAYPLTLAAVAAGVRALDEPTNRRQAAFLAFATLATFARIQYFVLVPAYLIAAVILERRDFMRRHRTAALALAPVIVALAVAGTGFYSGVPHLLFHEAILTWIPLQAFLMTLVAGVVIVPGAVAAVLRPGDRRETAFALLGGGTALLLLVESSVYAASGGEFKERYLFALVPLLAVAFGLYVRRQNGHRWIVFLTSVAVAIAAARLPVSAYATGAGRFDSQFLGALETFQRTLGVGSSSLIVAALATVGAVWATLIALLGHGRSALAFSVAVAVAASAMAVHRDLHESQNVRASLPGDLQWIDHNAHGPVTAIATPLSSPSGLFLELFWNPSVNHELALDDADPTDIYVKKQLQIAPDGTLRGIQGPFVFDDNGSWAAFTGATLVKEEDDYSRLAPGPQAEVPRSGRGLLPRSLADSRRSDPGVAGQAEQPRTASIHALATAGLAAQRNHAARLGSDHRQAGCLDTRHVHQPRGPGPSRVHLLLERRPHRRPRPAADPAAEPDHRSRPAAELECNPRMRPDRLIDDR